MRTAASVTRQPDGRGQRRLGLEPLNAGRKKTPDRESGREKRGRVGATDAHKARYNVRVRGTPHRLKNKSAGLSKQHEARERARLGRSCLESGGGRKLAQKAKPQEAQRLDWANDGGRLLRDERLQRTRSSLVSKTDTSEAADRAPLRLKQSGQRRLGRVGPNDGNAAGAIDSMQLSFVEIGTAPHNDDGGLIGSNLLKASKVDDRTRPDLAPNRHRLASANGRSG